MSPVVTEQDFARWIRACKVDEPIGERGQVDLVVITDGQLALRHLTQDSKTSDQWEAGDGGVFLLSG